MSISAIELLWRKYLGCYGEPQVRTELSQRWGNDPNVSTGRIQLSFPPTFQPGYVGNAFYEADRRILFLGYNPGEGRLPKSQDEDKVFAQKLHEFAAGQISLVQLSQFQATQMLKWPIYDGKGIFSDSNDGQISLLPKTVRPSIMAVAILNLFPFKTELNKKPLGGRGGASESLNLHMWECLVKPTIESLGPDLIVRYPDSDKYLSKIEQLTLRPRTVRVWHPSDYNLRAHKSRLEKAWEPLAEELYAGAR